MFVMSSNDVTAFWGFYFFYFQSIFTVAVIGHDEFRCSSILVKNGPHSSYFGGYNLQNCTVVEGDVYYLLATNDTIVHNDYQSIAMPKLREITGALLLYHISGIETLSILFPNLEVIRGISLVYNYALVINECNDLQDIGLFSLTEITHGGIRISDNKRLCFPETINWGMIVKNSTEHIIEMNNGDKKKCKPCQFDKDQSCYHRDVNGFYQTSCWTSDRCQRTCPDTCFARGLACNKNTLECCHEQCIGGCTGPTAYNCSACRQILHNGKCTDRCPHPLFMLQHRRCITRRECLDQTETFPDEFNNIHYFKPFKGYCRIVCPDKYDSDELNRTCVPCPNGHCAVRCATSTVRSLQDARSMAICDIIDGYLDINLRTNLNEGEMEQFNRYLSRIREVSQYVKISFCNSLYTLDMFRNLRIIRGQTLFSYKYALTVFENKNLVQIFSNNTFLSNLTIERGGVQFENNRKLCPEEIVGFVESIDFSTENKTELLNSISESNGREALCKKIHLPLTVSSGHDLIIARWDSFNPDTMDMRHLIGFQVYYKPVEDRNTLIYEDRDACTDSWKMSFVDAHVDGNCFDALQSPELNDEQCFFVRGAGVQGVVPYTLYAVYAETLMTEKKRGNTMGAMSEIKYIRTKSAEPSPPRLQAYMVEEDSIEVSWDPPVQLNGDVTHYLVLVEHDPYPEIRGGIDYCKNDFGFQPPKEDRYLYRKVNKKVGLAKPEVDHHDHDSDDDDFDANWWSYFINERVDFENFLQNLVFSTKYSNSNMKRSLETDRSSRSLDSVVVQPKRLGRRRPVVLQYSQTSKQPSATISTVIAEESEDANDTLLNQYQTVELLFGSRFVSQDEIDRFKSQILLNPKKEKGDKYGRQDPLDMKPEVQTFLDNFFDAVEKGRAVVVDKSHRSVVIRNLTHFERYRIKISACQTRQPGDNLMKTTCSVPLTEYLYTKRKPMADRINSSQLRFHIDENNKTEVVFEWKVPSNPNGGIIKYNLQWKKLGGLEGSRCVSASRLNPEEGVRFGLWEAGSYEFRLNAVSLGGIKQLWSDDVTFTNWTSFTIAGPKDDAIRIVVSVALTGLVVIVIICIIVFWYLRRHPTKQHRGDLSSTNPDYWNPYEIDDWELERCKIACSHKIGEGSFGDVYIGDGSSLVSVRSIQFGPCAIKCTKSTSTNAEFLYEATVMKLFDTTFIVQLYGVVSIGHPALIVMELMEKGNLKSYLRMRRMDSDDYDPRVGPPPSLKQIFRMSIEIADALAYLENINFVHADIAARNCLISADDTCKIGDFGMAREVRHDLNYYRLDGRRHMPCRWMAPECFTDSKLSSKTDVWAYGVLLWEIVTTGRQPYELMDNKSVTRFVIHENGRLERPETCHDCLWNLMQQCWNYSHKLRPTFYDIVQRLLPESDGRFKARSFVYSHSPTSNPPNHAIDLPFNQCRQPPPKTASKPFSLCEDPPDVVANIGIGSVNILRNGDCYSLRYDSSSANYSDDDSMTPLTGLGLDCRRNSKSEQDVRSSTSCSKNRRFSHYAVPSTENGCLIGGSSTKEEPTANHLSQINFISPKPGKRKRSNDLILGEIPATDCAIPT